MRATGLEPTRLSTTEPKDDVTTVKSLTIYVQPGAFTKTIQVFDLEKYPPLRKRMLIPQAELTEMPGFYCAKSQIVHICDFGN